MSSARRENSDDHDHGSERWLVSYADFITLMFAFFAILYATSQKDAEKSKEFQESIKRYLIKAGAVGGSGTSGQEVGQGTKNNAAIEPPIQTFNPTKPETVAILDEAEAFVESQLTKEERKDYVIDLVADEWGVRIVIPSQKIFAAGSDKFREQAVPFITKLGQLIAKTKRKVLIEGHVAENEKGSFHSTWDFASARAVNVLRFIQQKEKLSTAFLASASLADSRPLGGAQNPSLNSRIEVVLLNQEYEF